MAEVTLRRPVLRQIGGVWHCDGIPGYSQTDAYDRWLTAMTVPCGFVPRVSPRPA